MGLVTRALLTAGGLLLVLIAGLTWLVDPAGGHPGAAGPPGRRAAGGRPAAGAAPGHRRGRPRPAGDVVQPDGHQPPAPDPPARGAEPGAAPVRLRRLPRAAHPAHHGADGRRRAARRARATSTRRRPGPPSCCRPSSTASRPCSPTCSRSAASTPAPRCSSSTTSTSSTSRTGSSRPPGRWPSSATCASSCAHPTTRAWPRPTYAGSSGSCATWSPTPSTTPAPDGPSRHRPGDRRPGRRRRAGGGDRGARLRRRPGAGGVLDGLQPVLARRPGPGPHQRRHRPRPVDLPGGHPPARRLAAGVGPARRGLAVPAHPAAAASATSLRQSPLPLVPADAPEPVAMRRAAAAAAPRPRCSSVGLTGVRRPARRRPGRRDADLGQRRPARTRWRSTRSDRSPASRRSEVVKGFLDAMQATPIRDDVAREFLTERPHATSGSPTATIIYDDISLPRPARGRQPGRRHPDRRRPDRRARAPGRARSTRRTDLQLHGRRGGRRVPDRRPAGRPDRPADLVRAAVPPGLALLLRPDLAGARPGPGVRAARASTSPRPWSSGCSPGPAPELADYSRNLLPAGVDPELSVPVSDDGVATVDLDRRRRRDARPRRPGPARRPAGLDAAPGPVGRAAAGRIDGQPVTPPGEDRGQRRPRATSSRRTSPAPTRLLFGLDDGRMVAGARAEPRPGQRAVRRRPTSACASITPDLAATQAAGVTADGTDDVRRTGRASGTEDVGDDPVVTGRDGPAAAGLGLQRPAVDGRPAAGRRRRELPAPRAGRGDRRPRRHRGRT